MCIQNTTRIRPSVRIDLSTTRRKEETGRERKKERESFFSNVVAADFGVLFVHREEKV